VRVARSQLHDQPDPVGDAGVGAGLEADAGVIAGVEAGVAAGVEAAVVAGGAGSCRGEAAWGTTAGTGVRGSAVVGIGLKSSSFRGPSPSSAASGSGWGAGLAAAEARGAAGGAADTGSQGSGPRARPKASVTAAVRGDPKLTRNDARSRNGEGSVGEDTATASGNGGSRPSG
jgi:hypothetical protein